MTLKVRVGLEKVAPDFIAASVRLFNEVLNADQALIPDRVAEAAAALGEILERWLES